MRPAQVAGWNEVLEKADIHVPADALGEAFDAAWEMFDTRGRRIVSSRQRTPWSSSLRASGPTHRTTCAWSLSRCTRGRRQLAAGGDAERGGHDCFRSVPSALRAYPRVTRRGMTARPVGPRRIALAKVFDHHSGGRAPASRPDAPGASRRRARRTRPETTRCGRPCGRCRRSQRSPWCIAHVLGPPVHGDRRDDGVGRGGRTCANVTQAARRDSGADEHERRTS